MPNPTKDDLLALLDQALASPFGLVLKVSDPIRFRTLLCQARQAGGDPRHQELALRASPLPEGNLLIVRVTVPAPEAKPEPPLLPLDPAKLGL